MEPEKARIDFEDRTCLCALALLLVPPWLARGPLLVSAPLPATSTILSLSLSLRSKRSNLDVFGAASAQDDVRGAFPLLRLCTIACITRPVIRRLCPQRSHNTQTPGS